MTIPVRRRIGQLRNGRTIRLENDGLSVVQGWLRAGMDVGRDRCHMAETAGKRLLVGD